MKCFVNLFNQRQRNWKQQNQQQEKKIKWSTKHHHMGNQKKIMEHSMKDEKAEKQAILRMGMCQ